LLEGGEGKKGERVTRREGQNLCVMVPDWAWAQRGERGGGIRTRKREGGGGPAFVWASSEKKKKKEVFGVLGKKRQMEKKKKVGRVSIGFEA